MAAITSSNSSISQLSLPSRLKKMALPGLLTVIVADSAYLFAVNRASGPPRLEAAAFAYEGLLLLHLILGSIAAIWFTVKAISILKTVRNEKGAVRLFGALTGLAAIACLMSGILYVGIGAGWLPLTVRPPLRLTHDLSTALALIFGLIWLVLRAKAKEATQGAKKSAGTAVKVGLAIGLPFAGLLAFTLLPSNGDKIINPALPPMVADDEGDGKAGKFFPASAQSVDGQFFPSAYFMDSKSCGKAGCHPDIYAQWNSSAHHLSSFNNQYYRKAVEYAQEVVGVQPTKWCGGCHDMAVLLTEDPKKKGRSRFDTPIAEHDFPETAHPESHAGIGCAVCHSIVHIKSTMGNSDYLADYPPMHKYLDTTSPTTEAVHTFLTRLAPEPHKKTFMKSFHVDETAKFCSSCHKVHLDVPVNGFRWLRGQNTYDEWQQSGVSGFGAASFYYPSDEKTGKPAFKKCADCHMPNTPSKDAGNVGGIVHNHRFPGANTALPFVNHDKEQLAVTQKFLTDKAVSIDIFALRREKSNSAPKLIASSHSTNAPALIEAPKAASIAGDSSEGAALTAADTTYKEETLVAPLNRGGAGAAFVRGEKPLVDVVVRTLKLGHAFPAGTTDAFDIWVELEAKDDKGKVFYHSGALQWPDGPVEDGAERYRVLPIDGHSNAIDKRNVFAIRAVVYAKIIPPGAADTVHFRMEIPKDCGDKITLTAKLNYRKFTWFNNVFSYAANTGTMKPGLPDFATGKADGENHVAVKIGYDANGKTKTSGNVAHAFDDRQMKFDNDLSTVSGGTKAIPVLPITVVAMSSVTLPVVNPGQKAEAPLTPPVLEDEKKKEKIRWNDYGIGLLLQGDFRHATSAFEMATKVAPKWPEGYVNIGRVRQAERDSKAAEAAFKQAFAMYAAAPTPMTPFQKARTQNFYAQTLFDQGKLEESLKVLAEAREVFPQDRNMLNLTGSILFRLGRYKEASDQFKHTLEIDPEDITSHYNLMKCYRGMGDAESMTLSAKHEKLYKRFRADETTTNLVGDYQRKHPADNNLAQRIHEHADSIIHPKPDWLKKMEARNQTKKRPAVADKNVRPLLRQEPKKVAKEG